jgi:hypothetical protein
MLIIMAMLITGTTIMAIIITTVITGIIPITTEDRFQGIKLKAQSLKHSTESSNKLKTS